ncbi:MAG: response regulator [Anaerolineae bacterium]|nr:response regulator [Anaerolineae bacterium]
MSQDYSPDEQSPLILFVDDNAALLRSVERLLRLEGYRVMLAENGEDALRLLEASDKFPDMIISDISMPKLDGFDLFRAVRAREEWLDVPFLFLTARDQIEDLRQGYSLGADDYLVKPLDQERLLMVIGSKLKRRDELLQRIHDQQSALETARRELAWMVAHELRTPLVSISMVSEILSDEFDRMGTDQIRDMLDTMQSGSVRLNRLVEQMVMYVQLESGSLTDMLQQRARRTDLFDIVVSAIERARRFCQRSQDAPARFEDADADIQVNSDPNALRHAIAEVILNAFEFSPDDDEIVIGQGTLDDQAQLTIVDQGIGIPPEELEHVFEPYYQVNRGYFEQQGVGIGLTLARGIIEAHGGSITLTSVLGKGTRVKILLPLLEE